MSTHSQSAPRTTRRPTPATRAKRPTVRQRATPRRRRWVGWVVTVAVAAGVITAVVLGGRSSKATVSGAAPAFRLASTAGGTVSLADYRGRNVLLYFNEGVGCDACFYQMAKLEADGGMAKEGVTVLPVVMNSTGQVAGELRRFGVNTPYLSDPDGSVSRAYKTLGTGHHAELPGHSFILVGPDGQTKWRADYPGMWVEPAELDQAVRSQLAAS